MIAGEHGVPVVAHGPWVIPDVLLIPVNVFDQKGFRLGYGGGYYDRTLVVMVKKPYVVGVGFDLARVGSIRPHAFDRAVDVVVTESRAETFASPPVA